MESGSDWYYVVEEEGGSRQEGPVSTEVLLSMRAAGSVGAETLVWREGMADWESMGGVADLAPAPAAEAAEPTGEPTVELTGGPAGGPSVEPGVELPGEATVELPAELFAEPADQSVAESPAEAQPEEPAAPAVATEPMVGTEPVGEGAPGDLLVREFHAYSVSYSKSRGRLLVATNDYHAGPLALTKLDLLEFLTFMEKQER